MSASATFAVSEDNSTAGLNEMVHDENVLAADSDDFDLSEDAAIESQSNVVTKDTFHNYFDESETLLDTVSSDELVFEGDFTGLDVNYMMIGKPIKLSGNNVAINGVTFVIGADNVVIDGFALNQSDVFLFDVENVNGVTLSNNMINFKTLGGSDGYAIYANAVKNLKIINNTINYVGNTDGTVVNNAVRIAGDEDSEITSDNIIVDGNIFNIEIPAVAVYYNPDTWEAKILSEGIVFYYCDGVKFTNNRVDLKYNNFSGSYDTIYGVSVRGNAYNFDSDEPIVSSNVEISNNMINAEGNEYIYAVFVSADDFKLSDNLINSTSNNYAAAIDVDGPASSGVVNNNLIHVESPNVVYGIYSYQMNGAIRDMSYINNTIIGDSYGTCAMEIVENNPYIVNNIIIMNGNYTTGIAASIKTNGTISKNDIVLLGNNNGTVDSGDLLLPKNSLAISVKGNAIISENNIASTGIGINLVESGDITIKNNTVIVDNAGSVKSYAIYSEMGNLTILDNTISFIGNTTGDVVNNAIYVSGDEDNKVAAKNILVKNNTLDIKLPSLAVNYNPLTYAPTVMSEGIVFYYCENVTFVDNRVYLKYNNVVDAYDTIYVLSIKSNVNNFESDPLNYPIVSSDVLISNNTIAAEGHSYIYGIFAAADNFTVSDNILDVSSDGYYANGIDIDALSTNGVLKNNAIIVTAINSTYGIYSANIMGPVENITYDNNTIAVNSYAACGMELVEFNPYVFNNTIIAAGNYTYGIVAEIKDNATIISNVIECIGSEIGEDSPTDSMLSKKSLGISIKNDALIKDNVVITSGIGVKTLNGDVDIFDNEIRTTDDYTINAINSNLNVMNNYLVSKKVLDQLQLFLIMELHQLITLHY